MNIFKLSDSLLDYIFLLCSLSSAISKLPVSPIFLLVPSHSLSVGNKDHLPTVGLAELKTCVF